MTAPVVGSVGALPFDGVVPALRIGELLPTWALVFCVVALLVACGYAAVAHRSATVRLERYVPGWVAIGGLTLLAAAVAFRLVADYRPGAIVLLAALLVLVGYVGCLVPASLYQYRRRETPTLSDEECPHVSVLIPAYNERGYVGSCIESFLAADYPTEKCDLVVIDDGSTDSTYREAASYDDVTVLHRPNGGKYAALNYGLVYAEGEIVVVADADTRVEPSSLRTLVGTLRSDPSAGAVASTVSVANRGTHLARCQALEYALLINTFRRAFDWLGCVPIVSGCLGGFRREALEDVGGFDPDTLTEDFDATVQILRAGWTVRSTPARARTEAPSTVRDLYRQRLRWYRGNAMTVWKHRRALWGDLDGNRSFRRIVLPLFALSMTFLPIAGAVVLAAIVLAALEGLVAELAVVFAIVLAVQTAVAAVAIRLHGDDPRLVVYAPLLVVGFKQLLDAVAIKALGDVCRGSLDWTNVTRRAHRTDADYDSSDESSAPSGSSSTPWRS